MMVDFRVEPKRIRFFSKLRKKNFSHQVVKEAKRNLFVMKDNWFDNIAIVNSVFKIFRDIHLPKKIIVSVFPNDYFLGAAYPNKQLILYGQPARSKNFSTALIAHEISHIFLSKIKLHRAQIVDEIICFLIENRIHLLTEKKSLKDIWNFKELDTFHKKALQTALKYSDDFALHNKIEEIILLLSKNIDKEALKLKRTPGLIRNLEQNTN